MLPGISGRRVHRQVGTAHTATAVVVEQRGDDEVARLTPGDNGLVAAGIRPPKTPCGGGSRRARASPQISSRSRSFALVGASWTDSSSRAKTKDSIPQLPSAARSRVCLVDRSWNDGAGGFQLPICSDHAIESPSVGGSATRQLDKQEKTVQHQQCCHYTEPNQTIVSVATWRRC